MAMKYPWVTDNIIVWYFILSKLNITVVSYGPTKDHNYLCLSDLDLGDITVGHGHDTPFGPGIWNVIQIEQKI